MQLRPTSVRHWCGMLCCSATYDPLYCHFLDLTVRCVARSPLIIRAEVTLRAILDEKSVTLEQIAALKIGQRIELNVTPRSPVKLEANEQPLFWCQLGQSEGNYRLRIENVFDPEQEFLDDILNH